MLTFRKRPYYEEQQCKLAEAWDAATKCLANKFTRTAVFDASTKCSFCSQPAHYRCTDCGLWIAYCEKCCISQHSHCCFFHVPEKWESGQFIPVMIASVAIPLDHSCSTQFKGKMSIVTVNGLCTDNSFICKLGVFHAR